MSLAASSRPPTSVGPSAFLRFTRIHEELAKGARVTAAALAECFETSTRTIKRDIEHLRDFYGAPIDYDRATRG
jgi:predicted DNA-binding transcriptional regulator YafY